MDNQYLPESEKPFIADCLTLKVSLKNNQGKPIYIIEENHDLQLSLERLGVNQYCFLDDISKALKDDAKDPQGDFNKPIKSNEKYSPIIILAKGNSSKADQVYKALSKANIAVFRQDINKPYKLITCSGVESVRAEIIKQYRDNFSVGGNISEFDNIITSNVNTPAIPTGFELFDQAIDGGLYEGIYTIGAISSLGKTTFCINIADHIAEQGHDVIILSLEMSKYQIMSRSISRLTFLKSWFDKSIKYEWCKTSRGITDGSRYQSYCPEELELIRQAKEEYAKAIGQNLFIYEAVGDMTVDTAREIIEQHIAYTGNHPVVILDYLQLLQHPDKYINSNDKLRTDVIMTTMKRISRDLKIPIILISSLNRMSYNNEVTFSSFKESGAIEFSSDVVIGLQLAGVGRGDFDVNEAKSKDPREIELTILKNREGKIGQLIGFSYYPMFNDFIEETLIKG